HDHVERQKQPRADIDVQESEQQNNRTWESHRKKVGAKAGTHKTCKLRSTISRPGHKASLPAREHMERSFEIAGTRPLRFKPREIAEDLLLPARNQRFPVLHRSRIFLQRRLEPRRRAMLRAVPIPRIEADLHPNAIPN